VLSATEPNDPVRDKPTEELIADALRTTIPV